MKKSNVNVIIILLLLVVLVILLSLGIYIRQKNENEKQKEYPEKENIIGELENGKKINISEKIKSTKELDGLEIKNIKLTSYESETQFLAEVTNNTKKETEEKLINIILYDKNGNEIVKLGALIKKLRPGETTLLNAKASLEYVESYDLKILEQ